MAGKIPAQFIDELLNRVDIVDLIHGRVPLKKAGRDYQACCPFHDEKTPSFTVSREKQFYHCFGCGAHGSAVGFLMDYDNLGYVEAIEELATREGVDVPREASLQRSGPDHRPLYDILEESAAFYQQQLRQHSNAEEAINYLKQRGLSGDIAADFGIGYAPPGWNNLTDHLGNTPDIMKRLQLAGMLSESEKGKQYDRFRERIIFPIRNHRGMVIGFGGRILGDGKPKYLNSPETPVFHKGKELYGLYEARKALRKIEKLLVVEGYMDVVALAQFGIRFGVATLGTATTPDHLERLYRTTSEVVFCFDGDRAGRDAGWKALETTLPHMQDGREARFLFLPDGEDPDTLIRKEGLEGFQQRIAAASPLSDFLFNKLIEQVDMESLAGRARLAELAKPLLAKLPAGLLRKMMHNRLSEHVGVATEIPGAPPPSNRQVRQPLKPKRGAASQTTTLARRAIALLLQHPELANLEDLPLDCLKYQSPGTNLLNQLLDLLQNHPNLKPYQIIERWRGEPEFPHLETLLALPDEVPLPSEGLGKEFRGALERLNEQQRKQEMTRLMEKVSSGEASESERQEFTRLLSDKK